MENILNIVSFFLIALSLSFLVYTIRLRRGLRQEVSKRDETIKLLKTEFDELRLLTAGVTHEINNALFVIMGRTEQLLKKSEDPILVTALKNILKTSNRIATSVKGLRQVIYPDIKEVETFVDLSVLIEDVLKLSGQRLRNHAINLRLTGIENKVLKGRKNQLEQLIINMLNQSVERVVGLEDKWIQIVAADEQGKLNLYFMDSSGEVGDKISHRQFSEILEKNHGHLTVNQNNIILELPKPDMDRFHLT